MAEMSVQPVGSINDDDVNDNPVSIPTSSVAGGVDIHTDEDGEGESPAAESAVESSVVAEENGGIATGQLDYTRESEGIITSEEATAATRIDETAAESSEIRGKKSKGGKDSSSREKRRKKHKKHKKHKKRQREDATKEADEQEEESASILETANNADATTEGETATRDDDTLGGFIVRDSEAAIHEDEDDVVKVKGGIDSDRDNSDIEDNNEGRGMTAFDETLERLRARRAKRPKLLDANLQLFCNQMLQKMSEASQKDEKALEDGKPATAKLQMLDKVCLELVKPKWKHWFVSEGCCQVLAGWLAPFKDNSLPNLTLRQRILAVLDSLPISAQDLQSNDLGKVLVLLWQHEDETEGNRQLIRALIQKWMRPLLGLGSSHRQFLQERERAFENRDTDLQLKLIKAAREQAAASVPKPEDKAWERRRRTARVPINSGHNFFVQPKSQLDEVSNDLRSAQKSGRFPARQPRRPARPPGSLSIEGRGLSTQ